MKDSKFDSYLGINTQETIINNIPLMFSDTISLNRNYYPSSDIKEAVDKFNKVTNGVDPTFRYMLIRHPRIKEKGDGYVRLEEADISYEKVAGWLEEIWFDERNKTVYGNIKILNTPQGLIVRYLYEKGYPIGFSARISHKEIIEEYDKERNMSYFVKKGLTIKGFDFVINPAFALTWVRKENYDNIENVVDELSHEILEHYNINNQVYKEGIENIIKDVCITCDCELDSACGIYTSSVESEIVNVNNKININNKKLNIDGNILYGGNKMPEDKSLELEKLRLERDKLLTEKEKLEFELLKLQSKKETLEERVKELEEKDKELSERVYSKDSEFKVITRKLTEYEEKAKQLEESIKALEEDLNKKREEVSSLEQKMDKGKSKSISVELFGKTYDEENRPKIRIVPPSEKVSTKAWGDIPKLPIRKAVWLSNDNKVIREAFGVLDEGWKDDYAQLKYPHHELQPSETEGYDLDLVLNVNALRTAIAFALGRAGMYLSPEQKRALGRHLLKHYKELVNAGVVEDIPEGVKTLTSVENIVVEAENDEVLTSIVDSIITKGYLKIDVPYDDEDNEIADDVESVVVETDEEGNPTDVIKVNKIIIPEENIEGVYSDITMAIFKGLFKEEDDEIDIESLISQFDVNELFPVNETDSQEAMGMNDNMPPEGMPMKDNMDNMMMGDKDEEQADSGDIVDDSDVDNVSNVELIHEAIRRFAERGATPLEKYDVDGQDINKTKTFLLTLRELFTQSDTFETAVVLFLQLKSIYDSTMFVENVDDVSLDNLSIVLTESNLEFARVFVGALRELNENEQPQEQTPQPEGEGETAVAQSDVSNQAVENKNSEEVDEMAKLKEIIDLFNQKFKFSDGEVNEENIESRIEDVSKALKVMTIKSINLEMELAKQKVKEKLLNSGVDNKEIEKIIEKADELQNEILSQLEEGEEISQEVVNEFIDKLNELSSDFIGKDDEKEGEGVESAVDVDTSDYDNIDRKGSVKTEEGKVNKKESSLFEKVLYEI